MTVVHYNLVLASTFNEYTIEKGWWRHSHTQFLVYEMVDKISIHLERVLLLKLN